MLLHIASRARGVVAGVPVTDEIDVQVDAIDARFNLSEAIAFPVDETNEIFLACSSNSTELPPNFNKGREVMLIRECAVACVRLQLARGRSLRVRALACW